MMSSGTMPWIKIVYTKEMIVTKVGKSTSHLGKFHLKLSFFDQGSDNCTSGCTALEIF